MSNEDEQRVIGKGRIMDFPFSFLWERLKGLSCLEIAPWFILTICRKSNDDIPDRYPQHDCTHSTVYDSSFYFKTLCAVWRTCGALGRRGVFRLSAHAYCTPPRLSAHAYCTPPQTSSLILPRTVAICYCCYSDCRKGIEAAGNVPMSLEEMIAYSVRIEQRKTNDRLL